MGRRCRTVVVSSRRHWEMLVIACIVLAAAFVLRVRDQEAVYVDGIPAATLPPLCLSREWFGLPCPGCGLTRSFIYLAHGEWLASYHAHRLGWLLAAAVVAQIPYRIFRLRRPVMTTRTYRACKIFGAALIGSLIINWLMGILT